MQNEREVMEIEVTNKKGERVSKNYGDITKLISESSGMDFAGIGSQPTTAKFRDKITGKEKEMDLREVVSSYGYKDVQFKFDPKKAKDQGLLQESGEMSEHAYNLERIRSDKGRMMYLKDKGFDSVINDGDDYYGVRGGKMVAINNKLGFDTSDVFRLLAHGGRDLGAGVAVAATGVGAAATGGAALALAGAAGAGGAVAGEYAQRGLDSLMGKDFSKYNNEASFSEEALAIGKDALIGATGAIGGQFINKGIGALATAGAKGVAQVAGKVGFAEEFTKNVALKTEAGYLASKLPQGWMSKTATSEEAVALDLLKGSANKGVGTTEREAMLGEAKGTLASGSAKLSPVQRAEQAGQAELHKEARQGLLNDQLKNVDEHVLTEAVTATERTTNILRDNAYKTYKGQDDNIDLLMTKDAPRADKVKAFVGNFEKQMMKGLDKLGVKYSKTDEGFLLGLNEETVKVTQDKMMGDFIKTSRESVLHASNLNKIDKPIPDDVASKSFQIIMDNGGKLGNAKKAVFDFADSLKTADPKKVQDSLKGVVESIFDDVEKGVGDAGASREVLDAINKVIVSSAKDLELANNTRIGADKLLSAMANKDNLPMVLRELKDAAGTLGGGDETISMIARLEFQKDALKGNINKEAYQLMTPEERMYVNSYDMLKAKAIGDSTQVESFLQKLISGVGLNNPMVKGGLAVATGGKSLAVEALIKGGKKGYEAGGKQVIKGAVKAGQALPKRGAVYTGTVGNM